MLLYVRPYCVCKISGLPILWTLLRPLTTSLLWLFVHEEFLLLFFHKPLNLVCYWQRVCAHCTCYAYVYRGKIQETYWLKWPYLCWKLKNILKWSKGKIDQSSTCMCFPVFQIGQFLLTLPQHLEPFTLEDNPAVLVALKYGKLPYTDETGGCTWRLCLTNSFHLLRNFLFSLTNGKLPIHI